MYYICPRCDYETNKKIIESSEYTRLPVYKNSIDNELGTLHLKNSHSFLDKLEAKENVQNKPIFINIDGTKSPDHINNVLNEKLI